MTFFAGPRRAAKASARVRQLQRSVARMPLKQLAGCCMNELPDAILVELMQLKSQLPPPKLTAGQLGCSILL